MKIVIIGAGSVGTNLHHALELKGIRAELVHARPLTAADSASEQVKTAEEAMNEQERKVEDAASGQARSVEEAVRDMIPQGDCYIYTVADHVLREIVSKVHAPKALHLHTSGSMPIEVFGEDKPHAGVLYFLQSFSREVLIDDWSSIPCFIEGKDIDDIAAIYSLAQTLTSHIYEANQHDRERLHIAGVFANNYTNLMYRIAAEVLSDTQIPFQALLPLIDRTAAKVHTLPPKEAQTGPAVRGDGQVIAHHLEVLDQLSDGEFIASDIQFTYMNMAQILQTSMRPKEMQKSIVEILGQALEESVGTEQNYPIPSRRHRKRR